MFYIDKISTTNLFYQNKSNQRFKFDKQVYGFYYKRKRRMKERLTFFISSQSFLNTKRSKSYTEYTYTRVGAQKMWESLYLQMPLDLFTTLVTFYNNMFPFLTVFVYTKGFLFYFYSNLSCYLTHVKNKENHMHM